MASRLIRLLKPDKWDIYDAWEVMVKAALEGERRMYAEGACVANLLVRGLGKRSRMLKDHRYITHNLELSLDDTVPVSTRKAALYQGVMATCLYRTVGSPEEGVATMLV